MLVSRGVPVKDVENVNAAEFLEELSALRVDLIVSLNCPQKLKRPILSLPTHGCVNVHFGKLPKYRGILPIFYALLNREPSFGVTVHMMDEKLDNGEIVVQRDVPIVPGDTLETLYPKGFQAASELLEQVLDAFSRGQVQLSPNRESDKSYYSYPSWRMIREYRRLVRS
jgi:methionyl-tRNA formyltransferase